MNVKDLQAVGVVSEAPLADRRAERRATTNRWSEMRRPSGGSTSSDVAKLDLQAVGVVSETPLTVHTESWNIDNYGTR